MWAAVCMTVNKLIKSSGIFYYDTPLPRPLLSLRNELIRVCGLDTVSHIGVLTSFGLLSLPARTRADQWKATSARRVFFQPYSQVWITNTSTVKTFPSRKTDTSLRPRTRKLVFHTSSFHILSFYLPPYHLISLGNSKWFFSFILG